MTREAMNGSLHRLALAARVERYYEKYGHLPPLAGASETYKEIVEKNALVYLRLDSTSEAKNLGTGGETYKGTISEGGKLKVAVGALEGSGDNDKATEFPGEAAAHITVPNGTALEEFWEGTGANKKISFECWYYAPSHTESFAVFELWGSANAKGGRIYVEGENLLWRWHKMEPAYSAEISKAITETGWYYIVGVWEGAAGASSFLKLYVYKPNGTKEKAETKGANQEISIGPGGSINIGCGYGLEKVAALPVVKAGRVDEFAIYKNVLSEKVVEEHYKASQASKKVEEVTVSMKAGAIVSATAKNSARVATASVKVGAKLAASVKLEA